MSTAALEAYHEAWDAAVMRGRTYDVAHRFGLLHYSVKAADVAPHDGDLCECGASRYWHRAEHRSASARACKTFVYAMPGPCSPAPRHQKPRLTAIGGSA